MPLFDTTGRDYLGYDVVSSDWSSPSAKVFAPHVETSTGIILPDDYLKAVSDAVHKHGGLFVLDCIASGTVGDEQIIERHAPRKVTSVDVC